MTKHKANEWTAETLTNELLHRISDKITCPACNDYGLLIGDVIYMANSTALFCAKCGFRVALLTAIVDFGDTIDNTDPVHKDSNASIPD